MKNFDVLFTSLKKIGAFSSYHTPAVGIPPLPARKESEQLQMYFVVDVSPPAALLIGPEATSRVPPALDEASIRRGRRLPAGSPLSLRDVLLTILPTAEEAPGLQGQLSLVTLHGPLHLIHPPASLSAVAAAATLDSWGGNDVLHEPVVVIVMLWADASKLSERIGFSEVATAAEEGVAEEELLSPEAGGGMQEEALQDGEDETKVAASSSSGNVGGQESVLAAPTALKRPRVENKKMAHRLATVKEIRSVNALIEKRVVQLDSRTARLLCPVCGLLPAHPVVAPCCASTQCQGCYSPACCSFCGEPRIEGEEVRPHGGRVREVSLLVRELWPLYREELRDEGLLSVGGTAQSPLLSRHGVGSSSNSTSSNAVMGMPSHRVGGNHRLDLSPSQSLLTAPGLMSSPLF